MTADALGKIAAFVPRLEKIFLDDIYNDSTLFMDFIKSRNENLIDAWKEMERSIRCCPVSRKKIRCFSLPGKNKCGEKNP